MTLFLQLTKSINVRKLAGQDFTIAELQELTDSISAKKMTDRLVIMRRVIFHSL